MLFEYLIFFKSIFNQILIYTSSNEHNLDHPIVFATKSLKYSLNIFIASHAHDFLFPSCIQIIFCLQP